MSLILNKNEPTTRPIANAATKQPTLLLYLLANSPAANCLRKSKLVNHLGNWLTAVQDGMEIRTKTHLP